MSDATIGQSILLNATPVAAKQAISKLGEPAYMRAPLRAAEDKSHPRINCIGGGLSRTVTKFFCGTSPPGARVTF
ncbi:hypothetical protein [Actinomadura madurae]|uniref:hypothetical protein n=1 Tax=Actinomadura madurae TaxID=1993 RepID=UPI001160740F|nr:hypothetical protein [Actinomadura madurae]